MHVVELKIGPRFGRLQVKTGPSYKLKIGPSMLRNLIGPVFELKMCFGGCFFCLFLKILFFLQGERYFEKNKNKIQKDGPVFNL